MICAGIDAGSRTVKVVLVDADSLDVLASRVADQGVRQSEIARDLFETALADAGAGEGDVAAKVATGYARNIVHAADTTVTEITCQARGVRRLVPAARTLIDIGGQDSKVIKLEESGGVRDFAMNDRCAAGTGRFLEVVAARLGVDLEHLGTMAAASAAPAAINNTCVVFAETEIVSLLAQNASAEDIAAGVQASLASRVNTMTGGAFDEPVVFTGGVALLDGMVRALEAALGVKVSVAPGPQTTAALGAAITAARSLGAKAGGGPPRAQGVEAP